MFFLGKSITKSKPARRGVRTSHTANGGSVRTLKAKTQAKRSTGYSRSVGVKTVALSSKQVGKKNYISANSTRYKARFRREGIRYAQKKGSA